MRQYFLVKKKKINLPESPCIHYFYIFACEKSTIEATLNLIYTIK